MKFAVALALSTIVLLCCHKPNGVDGTPDTPCSQALARISFPAYTNGHRVDYFFNLDKTLAKTIYYNDSTSISRADTFYYNNGFLTKSSYSLNSVNFANPYAYTEWTYGGVNLIESVYYVRQGGAYPVYANTSYITDDSNHVLTGYQLAAGTLQKTRFEYDADQNLRKVYISYNSGAESLFDEYFDYDSILNPLYKLPYEFDYDLYLYATDHFSKHNYRRHIRGSNDETYQLTYYPEVV